MNDVNDARLTDKYVITNEMLNRKLNLIIEALYELICVEISERE